MNDLGVDIRNIELPEKVKGMYWYINKRKHIAINTSIDKEEKLKILSNLVEFSKKSNAKTLYVV